MAKLTDVFKITEKGDPAKFAPGGVTAPGKEPKLPRKFKVVLHNDDFTPADFVVDVLMRIFGKTQREAWHITNTAHGQRWAVAGVYTAEIAEQKVAQVNELSQAEGHPLKCTAEPE